MPSISSQVATVDYLQLLTVQLQNQDPIDPVDQEGMISELAQFSMLEGVEDLNGSFADMLRLQEVTQGVDLVGKEVSYEDDITGEVKTGTVDELFTSQDSINLLVNGETVSIGKIVGVATSTA
ncbi:flagellar hook capping FlgD N-terminal domain-containing protein [Mariniblastus fucicola]|uniref:Basal-body rod modification protein FlgD n=1 Tax=Mariniblastus fucicola TaxID=980251 RepID=A0A5B9PL04_9BACT|nr:flagellar hook capping FlgD N-terminal domain-containing protein [Mariniblastus fucicola]QEG23361.1 Basal-body rod modification protein FlgD [Mariniblastus fucicola]